MSAQEFLKSYNIKNVYIIDENSERIFIKINIESILEEYARIKIKELK